MANRNPDGNAAVEALSSAIFDSYSFAGYGPEDVADLAKELWENWKTEQLEAEGAFDEEDEED